jgi:hypothetical protein
VDDLYFLFGGPQYYRAGGAEDELGKPWRAATAEDAIAEAKVRVEAELRQRDWAHLARIGDDGLEIVWDRWGEIAPPD